MARTLEDLLRERPVNQASVDRLTAEMLRTLEGRAVGAPMAPAAESEPLERG